MQTNLADGTDCLSKPKHEQAPAASCNRGLFGLKRRGLQAIEQPQDDKNHTYQSNDGSNQVAENSHQQADQE